MDCGRSHFVWQIVCPQQMTKWYREVNNYGHNVKTRLWNASEMLKLPTGVATPLPNFGAWCLPIT